MNTVKKLFCLLLAVLMVVSCLAACGGSGDSSGEPITSDGPKYGGHTEAGELGLPVRDSGLILPCGATGRWTP